MQSCSPPSASPAGDSIDKVASGSPATASRVVGYDLARSLAILGMVVVHFALVLGDGKSDAGGVSAWIVSMLDGRAAATFVVLAGVGLTLRSRKAIAANDAAATAGVRRTLMRRGVHRLW